MRVSHLVDPIEFPSQCYPDDRLFSDALKEIAEWLNKPENKEEVIRIYLNVCIHCMVTSVVKWP